MLCLTAPGLSAQTEVRGVETRRVVYNGPEYRYYSTHHDEQSTEYYGFEFYNRNSIPVSVSIELWWQGEKLTLITTKDVVLGTGEKYILKQEQASYFRVHINYGHTNTGIDQYYVKYKAYKLE